jgi:hypothetical protein
MTQPSPTLESLTRRLADVPADFLGEPAQGGGGAVHTAALVRDVFEGLGVSLDVADLAPFETIASSDRNARLLVALSLWVIASEAFGARKKDGAALLKFLSEDVSALAKYAPALTYHAEGERREELIRLMLARTGRRPQGETEAVARDRLSSISGMERARLIAASRAAEQRARDIREALIKKAAEESADKWTRE